MGQEGSRDSPGCPFGSGGRKRNTRGVAELVSKSGLSRIQTDGLRSWEHAMDGSVGAFAAPDQ